MTGPRIDFDRVNAAALGKLAFVLKKLLPKRGGKIEINRFNARWRAPATGAGGHGAISLIAYARGVPQDEAARLLTEALGLDQGAGNA